MQMQNIYIKSNHFSNGGCAKQGIDSSPHHETTNEKQTQKQAQHNVKFSRPGVNLEM